MKALVTGGSGFIGSTLIETLASRGVEIDVLMRKTSSDRNLTGLRYRRIDGEWFFRRRREHHWYKADVTERPPAVDFDSWGTNARPPALPQLEQSWSAFWQDRDPTTLTRRP